jgi:competence protein ComGC
VYPWIWRHLPGGLVAKTLAAALLVLAAVAVLFLLVFPAVESLLPYNDVTVEPGASADEGS